MAKKMRKLNADTEGFWTFDKDTLPETWAVNCIGSLAETMYGGGTPSTKNAEYWGGDIPWTTTAIIHPDDIFLDRYQRKITKLGLEKSSSKIAPHGSVLIGTRVGVGKAVVTTFDIAINQDLTVLCPNDRAVPEYIVLSLKSPNLLKWFEENKRGTTIKGVTRDDVAKLVIPLPPLPEQKAIAGVLRAVQEAKEATEGVIAAARQLQASLMRHLFTYGPVPFDQADRVNLKETEIGPVPQEWDIKPIGDCSLLSQYGISMRGNLKGQYPILRMNNLQEGKVTTENLQYVDLDDDTFKKFRVETGDILFNRTNSFELVGKTSVFENEGDYIFASYLVRVQLDESRLLPRLLNYYMNMGSTQTRLKSLASRAVSQSNINATKLKGFLVPVPPIEIQKRIVEQIKAVDDKITVEKNRLSILISLFDSLLHNLMTGQVRVPVGEEAGA